jgi:hypothetical protein
MPNNNGTHPGAIISAANDGLCVFCVFARRLFAGWNWERAPSRCGLIAGKSGAIFAN